jgi:hypothetical protein
MACKFIALRSREKKWHPGNHMGRPAAKASPRLFLNQADVTATSAGA